MQIFRLGLTFITDLLKVVGVALLLTLVAIFGIWGILIHALRLLFWGIGLKATGRVFLWLAWPSGKVIGWFVIKLVQMIPSLSTVLTLSKEEVEDVE